jgi:TonB family protein
MQAPARRGRRASPRPESEGGFIMPDPNRDRSHHPHRDPHLHLTTANDRFKSGFAGWFWVGLVLATLGHVAIFVASPTFAIARSGSPPGAMVFEHIPEVTLPPEPEAIMPPAAPIMATGPVDLHLTIPPTTLDANPIPVAPPVRRGDVPEPGEFTVITLRPRLLNERDVARALERFYPSPLRDAGIGGTVVVWFFIDTSGQVRETRINRSSGFDALDQAALQVADRMEFSPAQNRDERVAVWVAIPITFEVRD